MDCHPLYLHKRPAIGYVTALATPTPANERPTKSPCSLEVDHRPSNGSIGDNVKHCRLRKTIDDHLIITLRVDWNSLPWQLL